MEFEWAPEKAAANLRKTQSLVRRGVDCVCDSLSITAADPDHSRDENRFFIVGRSDRGRLLLVAHAMRSDVIRIISVRRLTRTERRTYEEIVE